MCACNRERDGGLAHLPHWVQHPKVHHLQAQAIQVLHLFSDPERKKEHDIAD